MGEELRVRNEYRLGQWAEIIAACSASGLSNRAFCAKRGICEKTYYYWLRKLRQTAIVAAGEQTRNKLVEIDMSGASETGGTLRLSYLGAELTVTAETPAEALRTVLRVLREL